MVHTSSTNYQISIINACSIWVPHLLYMCQLSSKSDKNWVLQTLGDQLLVVSSCWSCDSRTNFWRTLNSHLNTVEQRTYFRLCNGIFEFIYLRKTQFEWQFKCHLVRYDYISAIRRRISPWLYTELLSYVSVAPPTSPKFSNLPKMVNLYLRFQTRQRLAAQLPLSKSTRTPDLSSRLSGCWRRSWYF